MRRSTLVCLLAATLLVGACRYEAVLTDAQNIPIDPALVGVWESIPSADSREPARRLLVLAWSPTTYLIHYPADDKGIYFRAYPVEVGGIACVQLKVVGTGKGPPETDQKRRFHVAAYELSESILTVRTLNPERVPESLGTKAELRGAFIAAQAKADRFTDPVRFRKIQP